jgi:hypothetical protein
MDQISDCCGASAAGEMIDIGLCPDCKEHCSFIYIETCDSCDKEYETTESRYNRNCLRDNFFCDECLDSSLLDKRMTEILGEE